MSKLSHSTTYTVLKRPEGFWTFIPDEISPRDGTIHAFGLTLDEAQDLIEDLRRKDCPRCAASKFVCDEHFRESVR